MPKLATAQGKPEIKSKSVTSIVAGQSATVILYGENLAPLTVRASRPQVSVKLGVVKPTEGADKAKGSKQVTLDVTTTADCPTENIDLTLEQSDGKAKAQATIQLPVIDAVASEIPAKKPNTSYADAMPLLLTPAAPSLAVTGNVEGDNPATFRFDAKAGQTLRFQLFAGRGGSTLDPLLRVRNSKHLSLALRAGYPKQDLVLVFTAPTDGTYYLELMDEQSRGGAAFTYRLSVREVRL